MVLWEHPNPFEYLEPSVTAFRPRRKRILLFTLRIHFGRRSSRLLRRNESKEAEHDGRKCSFVLNARTRMCPGIAQDT